MPFPMLQSMFDALYPPGLQWYWKADFVDELADDAIERHVEHAARLPTMQSTMHLYPIDGAGADPAPDATPSATASSRYAQVIVGVDPDPANARITAWARDYWEDLHPHSAGGAYVNMMMDEGTDRVRASYGDNYHRLVAVKAATTRTTASGSTRTSSRRRDPPDPVVTAVSPVTSMADASSSLGRTEEGDSACWHGPLPRTMRGAARRRQNGIGFAAGAT